MRVSYEAIPVKNNNGYIKSIQISNTMGRSKA